MILSSLNGEWSLSALLMQTKKMAFRLRHEANGAEVEVLGGGISDLHQQLHRGIAFSYRLPRHLTH